MGVSVFCIPYKLKDGKVTELEVVDDLSEVGGYGVTGWMAGVRNYSAVGPIFAPRGVPPELKHLESDYSSDEFGHTWFTIDELNNHDYDQIVEDRRCTINGYGGCTCEPGQGEKMTLREFLGEQYFKALENMTKAGADRVYVYFW